MLQILTAAVGTLPRAKKLGGNCELGKTSAHRVSQGLNHAAPQVVCRRGEHLPASALGQSLDTVDLVLCDLAEDEVPQLLRLMAEV